MKKPMRILSKKLSKSSDEEERKPLRGVKAKDMQKSRTYLIYGPSGTGKTTLAATFPGPIAFGDFRDKGTDSIREVPGVEVFPINDWEDVETFYQQAKGGMLEDSNGKTFKPRTIVIDTVTNMQQMAIEEVLANKKKKSNKAAGDWGSMTKQEWGEVASLMKQWTALYAALPMETVFLGQQRVFNDGTADSELAPEVGARLSPSVKDALNAAADVIGSTFIMRKQKIKEIKGKKVRSERSVYCLRVGPNPVYITKIRKPKSVEVPALIEDPEYADIIAVIQGEA
jgi:DNA polymerase III delta prime subunit